MEFIWFVLAFVGLFFLFGIGDASLRIVRRIETNTAVLSEVRDALKAIAKESSLK